MNLVSWIIVGLVAGWMADRVMGASSGALVSSLFVGVLGAMASGILAHLLFGPFDLYAQFNVIPMVFAFIGAYALGLLFRSVRGRVTR